MRAFFPLPGAAGTAAPEDAFASATREGSVRSALARREGEGGARPSAPLAPSGAVPGRLERSLAAPAGAGRGSASALLPLNGLRGDSSRSAAAATAFLRARVFSTLLLHFSRALPFSFPLPLSRRPSPQRPLLSPLPRPPQPDDLSRLIELRATPRSPSEALAFLRLAASPPGPGARESAIALVARWAHRESLAVRTGAAGVANGGRGGGTHVGAGAAPGTSGGAHVGAGAAPGASGGARPGAAPGAPQLPPPLASASSLALSARDVAREALRDAAASAGLLAPVRMRPAEPLGLPAHPPGSRSPPPLSPLFSPLSPPLPAPPGSAARAPLYAPFVPLLGPCAALCGGAGEEALWALAVATLAARARLPSALGCAAAVLAATALGGRVFAGQAGASRAGPPVVLGLGAGVRTVAGVEGAPDLTAAGARRALFQAATGLDVRFDGAGAADPAAGLPLAAASAGAALGRSAARAELVAHEAARGGPSLRAPVADPAPSAALSTDSTLAELLRFALQISRAEATRGDPRAPGTGQPVAARAPGTGQPLAARAESLDPSAAAFPYPSIAVSALCGAAEALLEAGELAAASDALAGLWAAASAAARCAERPSASGGVEAPHCASPALLASTAHALCVLDAAALALSSLEQFGGAGAPRTLFPASPDPALALAAARGAAAASRGAEPRGASPRALTIWLRRTLEEARAARETEAAWGDLAAVGFGGEGPGGSSGSRPTLPAPLQPRSLRSLPAAIVRGCELAAADAAADEDSPSGFAHAPASRTALFATLLALCELAEAHVPAPGGASAGAPGAPASASESDADALAAAMLRALAQAQFARGVAPPPSYARVVRAAAGRVAESREAANALLAALAPLGAAGDTVELGVAAADAERARRAGEAQARRPAASGAGGPGAAAPGASASLSAESSRLLFLLALTPAAAPLASGSSARAAVAPAALRCLWHPYEPLRDVSNAALAAIAPAWYRASAEERGGAGLGRDRGGAPWRADAEGAPGLLPTYVHEALCAVDGIERAEASLRSASSPPAPLPDAPLPTALTTGYPHALVSAPVGSGEGSRALDRILEAIRREVGAPARAPGPAAGALRPLAADAPAPASSLPHAPFAGVARPRRLTSLFQLASATLAWVDWPELGEAVRRLLEALAELPPQAAALGAAAWRPYVIATDDAGRKLVLVDAYRAATQSIADRW